MRNKRGEYNSIGASGGVFLGHNTSRGASHTADPLTQRSKVSAMNKAENRLRIIEKISKYREEKIKKEFQKLEEELKQDEQKQ